MYKEMEDDLLNFNGIIIPANQLELKHTNRSFRYGDGLFESIKMSNYNMPLLSFHLERMINGMKALKIDIPAYYSLVFFENEIKKLTKEPEARIRIQVFREDGGFYTPISNSSIFLIEANKKVKSHLENGLKIGWFDQSLIFSQSSTSNFKTNNSIPYILAAIHAKTYALDDCLLFNEKGNVVEAISSNLFLIKNNELITPALQSGCVSGVMRRGIINIAKENSIKIRERINLSRSDVFEADALFLSNAVQGIRWVEMVDFTLFPKHELINFLSKKIDLLFEKD